MNVTSLWRQSRWILVATMLTWGGLIRADWDPGTPNTKWVQYPDLDLGMDVLATFPKILADDFLCTVSGPITDIHIWGSWLNDQVGTITNFQIGFWSDIPAGVVTNWSMPGNLLWATNFVPSQYIERHWTNAFEVFYDPNTDNIIGTDTQVYQYNMFVDPEFAFIQSSGTVYWLSVQAFTTNGLFGWKTSLDRWNDDAVWGDTPNPEWNELRYPIGHPLQGQSIDLAFALTTIPEPGALQLVLLALGGTALFHRWRRRRG